MPDLIRFTVMCGSGRGLRPYTGCAQLTPSEKQGAEKSTGGKFPKKYSSTPVTSFVLTGDYFVSEKMTDDTDVAH